MSTATFAFKEVTGTEVILTAPNGNNFHGTDDYMEIDSIFQIIRVMVLRAALLNLDHFTLTD